MALAQRKSCCGTFKSAPHPVRVMFSPYAGKLSLPGRIPSSESIYKMPQPCSLPDSRGEMRAVKGGQVEETTTCTLLHSRASASRQAAASGIFVVILKTPGRSWYAQGVSG